MKKIKLILTGILSFLIVSLNVYATGASLSVSSSSIYSGESFTAYVNMNGAAAWNLHVASSGPVSGCKLDIADATLDALDTNKSFPVTCTSTGVGTITLTLSGDVTSANDGNAVNVSGSASVTVTNKPEPTPTPEPTPVPTPTPTPTPSPKPSNPQTTTPQKSSDTSIKTFSIKEIKDFNFEKDTLEYNLTLTENVDKLKFDITLNDAKATYEIIGNENLKVGDNKIIIKVTAEDNTTKEYTLNVKKEAICKESISLKSISIKGYILNYYRNNYNYTLKINNEDKLDINIENDNDKLTYEIIGNEKLKNNSKIEIKITDGTESQSYIINISKSNMPNIWLICALNVIIIVLIIGIALLLIRMKNNKKKLNENNLNID